VNAPFRAFSIQTRFFWQIPCAGNRSWRNLTSMQSRMNPGLTVEWRVVTALGNEDERKRIIAMKAYELFCLRGCEHGSDLEDWLRAERELSLELDGITIEKSDAGLEVSIGGEQSQNGHIFLSIAPSSVLIFWSAAEVESSQDVNRSRSTLSLLSLPALADPAGAEVTYRDDCVRLHLPYIAAASPPETHATKTEAAG
jgi:Protein of unknown function (DUF2934)